MSSNFHLNRRSITRCLVGLSLLFLALPDDAEAQSGRKGARSAAAVPVTTVPATEVSTSDSERPLSQRVLPTRVRILVGRQPTSRHLHTEDVIAASFVKRLSQYANLECSSIGDIKESQAVSRAKAEADAFVTLLKFDIDSYQEGTIILNSQDLQIEYVVFAPGTGKKQTKGKVYFQAIGGGRMRKSDWPNGTPIKITAEAAGIEAAEDLYAWLALTAASRPKH
ncbi:MAG: hypothetical protein ABR501_05605 [Pyrinomonadaceae bacterium]